MDSTDQDIRTIEVEFLRPGPPHNQLLSPLTQYLAVCGDAGAGTVSMPFEQAEFNRMLAEMRYPDDDEQDQTPRLATLRTVGAALGEVLGGVPGLIGALTDHPGLMAINNLRIVSSASELAMLPFELAKVPAAAGRPSNEWLSLRPGTPVCMTRRERSVLPSRRPWIGGRPKVLFIVGLEIDEKLEDRHRAVLDEHLAPWRQGDASDWEYEPLVQLGGRSERPSTIAEIRRALLDEGITLVHVLAHGAESETSEGDRVGLLLEGARPEVAGVSDDPIADVVTGERLASVLRSLPTDARAPSTFVIASCDSAYQADALVPGGSLARALHVAGVPLVIASQFPLTFEGSVLMSKMLYGDLFWGEHPFAVLARVRAELHAEMSFTHDWASLVVYEALPEGMPEQLERVMYERTAAALRAALDDYTARSDTLSSGEFELADVDARDRARDAAARVLDRLPTSAAYEIDRMSLRATFHKRIALVQFESAWKDLLELNAQEDPDYWHDSPDLATPREHLTEARKLYRRAAECFLQSKVASAGANLHWMMTQAICLDRAFGEEPKAGSWAVARRAAELDLVADDPNDRLWAYSSLAELELLRVFEDDGETPSDEFVNELVQRSALGSNYVAAATKRQFERYVGLFHDWHEHYAPEESKKSRDGWKAAVAQAEAMLQILRTAV